MSNSAQSSRRRVLEHLSLGDAKNTAVPAGTASTQRTAGAANPGRQTMTAPREQKRTELDPTGVHAGLWLDKYSSDLEKGTVQKEEGSSQRQLVNEVARLSVPAIYVRFFHERWLATLDEANATQRSFKVKGRMAIGLGNKGVLETSVTLHRTYGVPYIPGSALKGLAASYARLMASEENEWKEGSEAYRIVFGDTTSAGYVTFFDALYIPRSEGNESTEDRTEDCPLHPDIITVHHPAYYQGQASAPADWDSPNPVSFLSATGRYLIAIAVDPDLAYADRWGEKVFDLLEEALSIMGIGAKTSSGYGRMVPDDECTPPRPEKLSEADQAALQGIEGLLEKLGKMSDTQVASQIVPIYHKWLQLKSNTARKVLADAMLQRARTPGVGEGVTRQPWYQDVSKYVGT